MKQEVEGLFDSRPSLLDQAPPFQNYLRQFPSVSLPGIFPTVMAEGSAVSVSLEAAMSSGAAWPGSR